MTRYGKIAVLAIFFLPLILIAGPPDTLWTRTFGDVNDDLGYSVLQTSDGGYIICGASYNTDGSGSDDVFLVRVDVNGDLVWQKKYGGLGMDIGYSLENVSAGGYIIAGVASQDAYVVRVDSGGGIVWEKTFGGPGDDEARAIIRSADGNYVLAGSFGNKAGLIKLSPAGDTLWTRVYDESLFNRGCSVQESPSGGYIIAGYIVPPMGGPDTCDVMLIRTDFKGHKIWVHLYGGAGYDYGQSVLETSEGGYIIAGYSNSFSGDGTNDVYIINTDTLGNEIWSNTWGGAGDDRAYSVDEVSEGGYIIAGYSNSFGSDTTNDVYSIRINALGETLWTTTYGGSLNDWGYAVDQTSDGGYIIAGHTASFGVGYCDVYLIKTGSDLKINENRVNFRSFSVNLKSNPVKNRAIFEVNLFEEGVIVLEIYDALGRLINETNMGSKSSGLHEVTWSQDVSTGIYFYCLKTPWHNAIGKLVLIR